MGRADLCEGLDGLGGRGLTVRGKVMWGELTCVRALRASGGGLTVMGGGES